MAYNKEAIREYLKEYRRKHKVELSQKLKEYHLEYYSSHRNELLESARIYYQTHKEARAIYRYQNSQKLKTEVLTHYGNGKLTCVRCGYINIDALSIDHINGNGCKHRRIIGKAVYGWLKRNNFPSGYQTLCMNCQLIKREESKEHNRGCNYAI